MISFLLGICLLASCRFLDHEDKPDISRIQIETEFLRFEKALFEADTSQWNNEIQSLKQDFPDFYELFVQQIMQFGSIRNPQHALQLKDFISNPDIRDLYNKSIEQYPNINFIEKDFTTAFGYFKHYFPNKSIPKVITHISALGPAALTYDSLLIGINLDKFLGKESPFYQSVDIPKYLSRRFEKEYITAVGMKAFAQDLYPPPASGRLIDQMIYNGQLIYFLEKVLPDAPDSIISNFSQKHLNWLAASEENIWAYFVENDLLYENNARKYGKYINEAPTTPGMPKESPGQVGCWLGWQIVRAYMERHPDTPLPELMAIKDGQKVLQKARYKPKR